LKKNTEKEGYYSDELTKKFTKCSEGCKKCDKIEDCLICDYDSGYFSLKSQEESSSNNSNKTKCVKDCTDSYIKNIEKKTCKYIY